MEKKIRVIDLLNKIANGEEVPRKIHYQNDDFTLTDTFKNYVNEYNDLLEIVSGTELNDEVEILDEEDEFEDIEDIISIETPIDYDIIMTLNKLIKNQKKIIMRLKDE